MSLSPNNSTAKDILLCTLNSTYQHSSFGLRYLLAQMGPLWDRTQLLEWTIKENPRTIVEKILSYQPRIVGFGVYIWNTNEVFDIISILKKVSPQTIVVLGGPEISYETESQRLFPLVDHVICGEADFLFKDFCLAQLEGAIHPDIKDYKVDFTKKIIRGELPNIKEIQMPYGLYTDEDIKNRVIYVEASRGCPYKCEYCLSSLDKSVRSFDLTAFLKEIDLLITRGATSFKFVDRTFNLSPTTSTQILKFFLERIHLGLFLHFEMVPDRLPVEIRDLIKQFPEGSLQFEVGIQTMNPAVAANVSRKNDLVKVAENFKYLKEFTHVHSHADLIVGLPGETIESFGEGFNRLAEMGPDEIQVGILKRLKGTPITRHEKTFDMRYQDAPPYQILHTSTMNYQTLQIMNRFAKFWDLYANSGEFKNFMLWMKNHDGSFFHRFMDFVTYLSSQYSETHSISLINLAEKAYLFLQQHMDATSAETIIINDYCNGYKKRDIPPFLKEQLKKHVSVNLIQAKTQTKLNSRQLQHQ